MPNWVTNNLNIAEKDLETFKKLALDENGMVDFNILIPRPKDLDITAGCYEWCIDKYGFNKEQETKQNTLLKPVLDKLYNENLSQDEFVKLACTDEVFKIAKEVYNLEKKSNLDNILRGYYNLRKYGYTNWYDWCREKWGTKWNASETFGSGTSFTFDTAWNTPYAWLEELSKHVSFKGSFADEDLGNNCGLFYRDEEELYFDTLEDFNDEEKYYIAYLIKGWEDNMYLEEMEMYAEDMGFRPVSDERREEIVLQLQEYL